MAKEADKATALRVLRTLRRGGHKSFFAGGCVRDMLLGRRCCDYDIATQATPQQVKRLFRRVLMVGAKFGVAVVLQRDRMVEVATFRSDLSYSDGRRPDGVKFSSPKEDALRRDFTINGMFFDPVAGEVIDYVAGQADLAAGIVRTIGKPDERFAEDYLRMMRAVRFAVRLGFRIDPATARGIRKYAPNITQISGERICEELRKIFAAYDASAGLELLEKLGLAEHILPEFFDIFSIDIEPARRWHAAVARVEAVAPRRDAVLSFGALLMDLSSEAVSKIMRRWGQSNELRKTLQWFCDHRDDWKTAAESRLCDFKRLLANQNWERLKRLWNVRERLANGNTRQSRRIARRAGGLTAGQIAPEPFVTGENLLKMGLPQGPSLGRIRNELYDDQLDEILSTRREALAKARKLVDEIG